MNKDKVKIPLAITKLLIAYFNQTITSEEHDLLDAWIISSYENMEIFSECIDVSSRPYVYNPDAEKIQNIVPSRILLN